MTKTKDITFFKNKLLEFIAEPDPLFSMMQWITEQLMEIKVSKKANAKKGVHSSERKTYRCGTRLRRFDTRLGTMYFLIPKLREGGYIPFFETGFGQASERFMQSFESLVPICITGRNLKRRFLKLQYRRLLKRYAV